MLSGMRPAAEADTRYWVERLAQPMILPRCQCVVYSP